MKEVFEYYIKHCYQAMIHQDKVSFEFAGDYLIEYIFEKTDSDDFDDDYFSFNTINSLKDMDELFNRINQFTTLVIKGNENLGYRKDYTEGKSLTIEMYSLVKKINSFRKDALLGYNTYIDYGDPMCDVEPNYFYTITIIKDLWWDIEFAKYFSQTKAPDIPVPQFYAVFFRKNEPIRDNKMLSVLSTNTKARRIGYFKILSFFLQDYKKIPATSINKKFENYCLKYKNFLEENQYKKGLIGETKTGISAKPYIDLADDLGLLNRINNVYYSGKSFKVYQKLQSQFSKSKNIFELSDFDKIFFLEFLLRADYFYLKSLMELLYVEGNMTYSILVTVFQNKLLSRLENLKQSNSYGDRKVLNNIDSILQRIKKWGKAEVYLEHIIMPRLNWMLDFGIVKGNNNEFEITEIGSKVFQHLCIWNDINTEEIISPDSFLDRFMIHLYDDCFNQSEVINPKDAKVILDKVFKHIDDSFNLFKTLAPNRVTASQAANYAKYKLYLDDNIKVGYQYILGELSEKGQKRFIFKYQEQYKDGYIQKMN